MATCGTAFGADHVRVVRRLLGDVDDPAAGVVTGQGREARGGEESVQASGTGAQASTEERRAPEGSPDA